VKTDLVLAFVGLDGFSQTRQGRTLLNANFLLLAAAGISDLRSALS